MPNTAKLESEPTQEPFRNHSHLCGHIGDYCNEITWIVLTRRPNLNSKGTNHQSNIYTNTRLMNHSHNTVSTTSSGPSDQGPLNLCLVPQLPT
eukprot:5542554-Amphidinium_carterae.1